MNNCLFHPSADKNSREKQTESPVPSDGNLTPSSRATRGLGRKKVGRKPKSEKIDEKNTEVTHDNDGSDTEDSADRYEFVQAQIRILLLFNRNYSGLVEECVAEKITVPLKNPYVKRKLDIARFEKIKTFGQDVTVTFHDWEWRGGNNSKVIKKEW